MLETRLRALEGGGHIEDRFTVLDGADAARAEAVAVAQGFHVVNDRLAAVARAQEVAVERMHAAFIRHRLLGGVQRLADHLPAEHLAQPQIFTLAAEQPFFDFLQIQQIEEVLQCLAHKVVTFLIIILRSVRNITARRQHLALWGR